MTKISPCGTFIDLFAGCGGLSLGLLNAGWRGILAVEQNKDAFETYRHNLLSGKNALSFNWHSEIPQESMPISLLIRRYGETLRRMRGKIDLVAGGPPCQGFSFAGRRRQDDPRNSLFRDYIAVVELTRPSFLLLENVKGISSKFGVGQKAHSDLISEELEKHGYKTFSFIRQASEFGVPQLRPRYIVVGVNQEQFKLSNWESIKALIGITLETNRIKFLKNNQLAAHSPVTVKDAISDLTMRGHKIIQSVDSPNFSQIAYDGPESTYQTILHKGMRRQSPNSMRLANHREKTLLRFEKIRKMCRKGVAISEGEKLKLKMKKHCFVILHPNQPSHTLTTLPDDLLHYSENRILTVREFARIQSFPDWFSFQGNYTTGGKRRVYECPRYTQVGNAVAPFVSEVLGMTLAELKMQLAKSMKSNAARGEFDLVNI